MYRLHGIPDWGSQVIRMALEELGVPYEFRELDFDAGDLSSPDYLALNPFGRLPVLETIDGGLFETGAILHYLSEKHHALAPAVGDSDRARFLVWFTFVVNQLHPTVMTLVHPERPGGDEVSAKISAVTRTELQRQLAALDTEAAKGDWWLSAARPSILSLYVLMLLRWAACFAAHPADAVGVRAYPALFALAKGMERGRAVQRVMAEEGLSGAAFSDPQT